MHKHGRESNELNVSWQMYMHQSKRCGFKKCTFMFMSPSYKQYVHRQEIFMHMSVMHILTLWSWVGFGRDEPEYTRLYNTEASTKQSKHQTPRVARLG